MAFPSLGKPAGAEASCAAFCPAWDNAIQFNSSQIPNKVWIIKSEPAEGVSLSPHMEIKRSEWAFPKESNKECPSFCSGNKKNYGSDWTRFKVSECGRVFKLQYGK